MMKLARRGRPHRTSIGWPETESQPVRRRVFELSVRLTRSECLRSSRRAIASTTPNATAQASQNQVNQDQRSLGSGWTSLDSLGTIKDMTTYRFDCKTIDPEYPSRNRTWFTIADGNTPEEAFARVQSHRLDEEIEILATWVQISGKVPAMSLKRMRK
jgi:hypothetical protein